MLIVVKPVENDQMDKLLRQLGLIYEDENWSYFLLNLISSI